MLRGSHYAPGYASIVGVGQYAARNGPVTARGQEMGTRTGNFPVLPPLRACMRGQVFRILLHRSLSEGGSAKFNSRTRLRISD